MGLLAVGAIVVVYNTVNPSVMEVAFMMEGHELGDMCHRVVG